MPEGGAKTPRVSPRRWTRKKLWDSVPGMVRRMFAPVVAAVPPEIVLGGRFREQMSFAEDAQHWDGERAQAYQLDNLRRICTLACQRTPYYHHLFEQAGFDPGAPGFLDSFVALPTIDRNTLRDHLGEMCTVSPGRMRADFVSTGGTSGEPVRFFIDMRRSATEYAYLISSWHRAGFELGMPLAVFRGRVIRRSRDRLRHEYDPILRHHYYSAFHMTDENIRFYIEHLAGIGPCFLHVYPSTGAALARYCMRSGTEPPQNIRGIIAESEVVHPDQRRMVEAVFGCRYFSCYGHSEKLVLAAECESCSDYHVWPTYGYFELLDENERPVTTPGKRGEIVGTGFINTVVPFIRYRTGDFATYVGPRCRACGRQHTIIKDIRGHRTQEFLVGSDGTEISWTALNMHDDTFAHVRQFQFRQDTPGRAVLRIVPADGFGDRDRVRIPVSLNKKLDGQLRIEIELTDSIPLSPRGKAVYVDQHLPVADTVT